MELDKTRPEERKEEGVKMQRDPRSKFLRAEKWVNLPWKLPSGTEGVGTANRGGPTESWPYAH